MKLLKSRAVLSLIIIGGLIGYVLYSFIHEIPRNPYLKEIIFYSNQNNLLGKSILGRLNFRLAERQLSLNSRGHAAIYILVDNFGNKWLFKATNCFRYNIEEMVYNFCQVAGIDAPACYSMNFLINEQKVSGSIQEFVEDAESLEPSDIPYLKESEISYIQKQQVLDWLIVNVDNALLLQKKSGKVWGIDKNASFWGIPLINWKLSDRFAGFCSRAEGHFTQFYINDFWRFWLRGDIDVDMHAPFALIDHIQSIPDKYFLEMFHNFLKSRDWFSRTWRLLDENESSKIIDDYFLKFNIPIQFLDEIGQKRVNTYMKKHLSWKYWINDVIFTRLLLRRRGILRETFTNFYFELGHKKGIVFKAPPVDRSFLYSRSVLENLKKEVEKKKQVLAQLPTQCNANTQDLKVISSGLGRCFLVTFFFDQKDKTVTIDETISKLREAREKTLIPEERLALSLYILVLESDIQDKFSCLDKILYLNPKEITEAWLYGIYKFYKNDKTTDKEWSRLCNEFNEVAQRNN